MMGVCFDCLVEVDGRQNVQSCMVEVSDGMQVSLPAGARRAEDAQ
jgi:NADH dehydrogenase/NADH:ubiquinone oxidoreductase subunit G